MNGKKRKFGHRHMYAQKKDHTGTQGEGGDLQVKQKDLRKN